MTPAKIRYELDEFGITQKSIAIEEEVSETAISLVIRKKSTSDRLMKAVAEKIKRDHREVFPEHYFKIRSRKRAA